MYVYIKSEPGLYTVGFYRPDGGWVPEGDYPEQRLAAERVSYLNGGGVDARDLDPLLDRLGAVASLLEDLRDSAARIARNV